MRPADADAVRHLQLKKLIFKDKKARAIFITRAFFILNN
jgi:hypothetical protein